MTDDSEGDETAAGESKGAVEKSRKRPRQTWDNLPVPYFMKAPHEELVRLLPHKWKVYHPEAAFSPRYLKEYWQQCLPLLRVRASALTLLQPDEGRTSRSGSGENLKLT